MAKKVKWSKLSLSPLPITHAIADDHISLAGPASLLSHDELLSHANGPGRFTIRGENGAGKSTALLMIKKELANKAFFLPTHNHLSFVAETNKYSTGESLKNRLIEILDEVEADVLLLDEWDANLDSDNKEKLSKLIDELAAKKCVIEVRHR